MFTNFHLVVLRQDESNLSDNEQKHSEMISVLLPLAMGAIKKYIKKSTNLCQSVWFQMYVSGLSISIWQ